MTDRDMFVELTLQLAHDGREPSAADKARNLAALRERLGLPVASALPSAGVSNVHVSSAPAPGGLASEGSVASVRRVGDGADLGRRWRLLGASTATGVVGFVLGLFLAPALRPELAQTTVAGPALEVAAPEAAAVETAAVEEAPLANGPGERALFEHAANGSAQQPDVHESEGEGEPSADLPSMREPSSANVLPSGGAPRGAEDTAANAGRARRVLPRARATAKPAATDAPDFLEAVRWLRRAQRAVRRGEGALALGLLDEIDRRFPAELLGEERQATRVLGLCGTGEDERAKQLAHELLAKSPRSIYAERLRASCAASAIGSDAMKNHLEGRE